MAVLEHHIQSSKSKAYYKASNYQRSINTRQEKVDILGDIMEAEHEYGWQKMHFLEEELSYTSNNSSETMV